MKLLKGVSLLLSILIYIPLEGCLNLDVDPYDKIEDVGSPNDPEKVVEILGNSFRNLHNVMQGDSSVALAMSVMADQVTCSWGSYGMRELSVEPRVNSYKNQVDYEYFYITENPWRTAYRANADANLALQKLYGGMDFGIAGEDNELVEAFSWFVNGVAHAYIAMVFDRGALVRWNSDLTNITFQPWQDVADEALEMLNEAIRLADASSFTVPADWVGGQAMTNAELSQLANSWAARVMVYTSRTNAQTRNVDWAKVLEYAVDGIQSDFAPLLGVETGWFDDYTLYARYTGWGMVDMRILNLLDHNYYSHYPEDMYLDLFDQPVPGDSRIESDIHYLPSSNFSGDYYFFSPQRYTRYDHVFETTIYGLGPKPTFMAWEVKLLEAEARFRTGDTAGALAILNDPEGPRKVRGQLPDLLETDDILRYILDEKDIECYLTGAGISYFDMRRTDRLQAGTLLHFPVPASDLVLLGQPVYTIHAYQDGIEGSAGGWTGWDEE